MFVLSVIGMDDSPNVLDRQFCRKSQAVASFNVWRCLVEDGIAKAVRLTDRETGEVLFHDGTYGTAYPE